MISSKKNLCLLQITYVHTNLLCSPANAGLLEQSAFLPMWMDSKSRVYAPNDVIWSTDIEVDSNTLLVLSFLSPMADSVTLTLTDSNGNNVPLSNGIAVRHFLISNVTLLVYFPSRNG